jgi:peptidoglycan/LPS O-acetylase OafA/YrhL
MTRGRRSSSRLGDQPERLPRNGGVGPERQGYNRSEHSQPAPPGCFLSGLVVTNSLLEKPSAGAFVVARLFRLMPAMIVCVFLTAFVFGPAVTSLPLAEYFSGRRTGSYVIRNIILITQSDLPGVFADHRNTAVNGSLWTLPFEVLCYLGLAVLGWFGLARHRSICSAVMIAVIAYAIVTYAVTVGLTR